MSPDGDRSQMLAIVGASVISLTLFISMFTSAGYAMSIMMPGEAAVLTLSDKFLYISLAMLVTALVAAAQWDALAIDYRDAVILQPLPIRPAALRLAKLTAVAALGAGVAIAVNIFPTIVFPWMLAFAVPQMSACATVADDHHAGRDHGGRGDLRLSGGDRDSRMGERVTRRRPVRARLALAADDRDRAGRQRDSAAADGVVARRATRLHRVARGAAVDRVRRRLRIGDRWISRRPAAEDA